MRWVYAITDLIDMSLSKLWGMVKEREAWGAAANGTPAACSFPGEKARSWGALGEARPGQSSLLRILHA